MHVIYLLSIRLRGHFIEVKQHIKLPWRIFLNNNRRRAWLCWQRWYPISMWSMWRLFAILSHMSVLSPLLSCLLLSINLLFNFFLCLWCIAILIRLFRMFWFASVKHRWLGLVSLWDISLLLLVFGHFYIVVDSNMALKYKSNQFVIYVLIFNIWK